MKHLLPILATAAALLNAGAATVTPDNAFQTDLNPKVARYLMGQQSMATDLKAAQSVTLNAPANSPFKAGEQNNDILMVRNETAMYISWGTNVSQSSFKGYVGYVRIDEDGTFYLKDPFIRQSVGTYLKGKLADGIVTFDLPQTVAIATYEDGHEDNLNACVVKLQENEDGTKTYVVDEDKKSISFTWDGQTLKSQDSETILGMVLEADGGWIGYSDWDLTWSVQNDIPTTYEGTAEAEPFGSHYFDYFFMFNKEFAAPLSVIFDGNNFYMYGLYGMTDDMVVKGTIEGDKAYIPLQYLGIDTENNVHVYFYPLNQMLTLEGMYFNVDERAKSVYELEYDANTKTFKYIKNNTFSINAGKDSHVTVHTLAMGAEAEFAPFDKDKAAVPGGGNIYSWANANPTWGMFTFNFSKWDVNKNYIDPKQTYYSVYYDDELFHFDPETYKLSDDSGVELDEDGTFTEIPLLYKNNENIFAFNWDYSFQISTFHDWKDKKVGIQTIYKAGGQINKSDIYYCDGTVVEASSSEVKEISTAAEATVTSVKYFDLCGRQIEKPAKGLCIRTETLSDGSLRSTKISF